MAIKPWANTNNCFLVMCNNQYIYSVWICFLHCLCFDLNKNNLWHSWHRRAYAVYVQWILSKMEPGWSRGDTFFNKIVFFFFFVYKKCSRSFVKLRLNPSCHMDYFTDLLAIFLDLDRVNYIAVYGGSESSQNAPTIS